MENELVRTQYVIMSILKRGKAVNHMRSMTLEEISEQENRCKINTLYKHIRVLKDKGLVALGAKVEHAHGYYLSEEGLKLLNKYSDMEECKHDEC